VCECKMEIVCVTDHSAEAEEASVQDMANEVNIWFPSCNKYVYISTRGSSVAISLTWLFNTFYIQSSLDFELKNISHWVLCSTLINLNRTWNKIKNLGIVPFSISSYGFWDKRSPWQPNWTNTQNYNFFLY
jgi:hypothetical protein